MEHSSKESLVFKTEVYPKRWYILGLFSLLGFLEALVFNTWGPIANSAMKVFPSWSGATVALLTNWGNIFYVLFLLPVCWLIDVKGMRMSVLFSAGLALIGSALRCVTMSALLGTMLINLGQILNGIAVIVIYSGLPVISSVWFPVNERTTATSVSTSALYMGIAAGSLIGPLVVTETLPSDAYLPFEDTEGNRTRSADNSSEVFLNFTQPKVSFLSNRIEYLMYGEFFVAVAVTFMVIVDFPNNPESPPSVTASLRRLSFGSGIHILARDKNVWRTVVPYALTAGVYLNWITMLALNLHGLGVSESSCGWLGFYSMISGCCGAVVVARLIDYIGGKMKLTIILLLIGSSSCFTWFTCVHQGLLPFTMWQLYISVILGGTLNSCVAPLFFELAVETAFPVAEGIVGGYLTGAVGVVGSGFLLCFFIPNIGIAWMNYVMIACSLVPIPILLSINEQYGRTHLDGLRWKPRSVSESVASSHRPNFFISSGNSTDSVNIKGGGDLL